MEFVNPLFLYGLIAIAIPIIIHLFNFRKFRKVYFTNVKFLEELQQKTRKQSQLRHLLTLLMRILAIVALVMAFAQPYIPATSGAKKQETHTAVSIYLDNSFSMALNSSQGTLLQEAVARAREVAMAYSTTDIFQLLTNDFEGYHQRYVSRDEFLESLNEVEISPLSRTLSEVIKRQTSLFNEEKQKSRVAVMISDFQKNICDFGHIQPDSGTATYLIPVTATEKTNLYVDTVWFEAPAYRTGQLAKLNVRISNASDDDFEKIPAKLIINGQQRAIASFDIYSGRSTDLSMPFTVHETGIHYARLEITDHPITYDDALFFTFEVKKQIPLLAIHNGEESPYLHLLFDNDSSFIFKTVAESQLDYSSFNQFNLIIINGLNIISSGLSLELKRFVEGGGSVVVFPGEMADLESYRQFFQQMGTSFFAEKTEGETKVSGINTLNRVYDDVFENVPENIDLPAVSGHYVIRRKPGSLMESLLEMQNGNIFLGAEPASKGMLYLFAVPLNPEWSNFAKHAIFVPTLYKIGLLGQGPSKLYYMTGRNENISIKSTLSGTDQVFKIVGLNKDFEMIPEIRPVFSQTEIFTRNQIRDAGHYQVIQNGNVVAGLAFNYNRKESDLDSYNKNDLETILTEQNLTTFSVIKPEGKVLTDVISELNAGIRLWKWFVILALVFLSVEVFLLRFIK
ncbi:MAG TPA: BatA domain-containing protein [Bacteroidales bacterium]|nr:BatA domain-containing protein [Bacteroidales bacterium]